MAEAVGWRKAFFIIGIPGVLFAVALALFVREPLRGRWDGGKVPVKSSFGETMAVLRKRAAFWYIALGCAFTSFVAYGNGNFFPSYLIRNHGMSLGEVGTVLGLISGLAGAVGMFLGGVLGDRFGQEDKRWYLWVPMWGCLIATVPYLYTLLGNEKLWIIVALVPANILSTMYLGPSIAMCQTLVSPGMRAMASAVLFFVLNMIGLGLGPLIVGVLSDAFQPVFGDDNLRYAMLITLMMGSVLGPLCFWLGARHLRADMASNQSLLASF
jgi:predicted MFS family arabinose efflux permease